MNLNRILKIEYYPQLIVPLFYSLIDSWKDKERQKKEGKFDLIIKEQLEGIQEDEKNNEKVSKDNTNNIKQKKRSKLKKNSLLLNYLPSHGGRVQCHLCANTYADIAGLRHHQKVIHEGQRIFCQQCGESFKGPSSFAVHKRVVVRF